MRAFNDWEVEVVASIFQLLGSHIPSYLEPNRMRWKLYKNGLFDSGFFYHALKGGCAISLEEHLGC
jgi:hypothetical protein